MDKAKAKGFMGTMLGILNGGSLAIMVSVGHRTGLFDAMAPLGTVTSAELADAASLDERYVREWLAALTAGGIVEFDSDAQTYELPPEHEKLVTRAGGPLNVASTMQYIALMGQVEDDVVEAFTTGAGVPYSRYPAFQSLMAEESAARFDAGLLSEVLPSVDGLVDRLESGIDVADVGCGSGHALVLMANAFPNSSFVGYDFSDEALTTARTAAADAGLSNLTFVAADAAEIDAADAYDFITTFDAIHDQAYPDTVLSNISQALRADGAYLCVEPKAASALEDNLDDPMSPYLYTVSTMHCMSVSIAGGGEGLGTAWGTERIIEHLADAGFPAVDTHEHRSDRANTHFVCRKS